MIDFHTHQNAAAPGTVAIRNIHQGEKNEFSPLDFPFCTLGLHPWFLEKERVEVDFEWLEENLSFKNVLAIGEAGLDKVVATPFDLQLTVFERQIALSEQLKKPLILHCVRAFDDILALKKKWRPTQIWVLHGFDKHPNTAQTFLGAGFYFSFGAALLKTKSHAAAALQAVPPTHFFLETDDKLLKINEIYQKAADVRACSLAELEGQVRSNFQQLFGF